MVRLPMIQLRFFFVTLAAAALCACSSAGSVLRSPLPSATPIGTGQFSFSPASPYSFGAGPNINIKLLVSEGNYTGGFNVTGATQGGGDFEGCSPITGGYGCFVGSSGANTSLSLIGNYDRTVPNKFFVLGAYDQGSGLPIRATFSITDEQGHVAHYTATAPGH